MDDRFVEFILKPDEAPNAWLTCSRTSRKKANEQEGQRRIRKMGDKNEDQKDRRMAIEGPEDNKAIEPLENAREKTRCSERFESGRCAAGAVWGTNDRAIGNDAVNALGNLTGNKVGAASGLVAWVLPEVVAAAVFRKFACW